MQGSGTPAITVTSTASGEFVFDLLPACTGGTQMTCGVGGPNASGRNDWSFTDNVSLTGQNQFTSRNVAWPNTVYIRVYRLTAGESCDSYTLSVARKRVVLSSSPEPNPMTLLDGLPPDLVSIDLQTSAVRLTVDATLYPIEALYGAAYVFIDRCYVLIDHPDAEHFRVTLTHKKPDTVEAASRALVGEFANELLSCAWRQEDCPGETGRSSRR